MAASSPEGDSFVWKTTPNEPLPTILHCVYCRSLVSPVTPSWTFSRMTSAFYVSTAPCEGGVRKWLELTSHAERIECRSRAVLRHGDKISALGALRGIRSRSPLIVREQGRVACECYCGTPCWAMTDNCMAAGLSVSVALDRCTGWM
jgi:hypothetical protein